MLKINRIKIQNFRQLKNVDLKFEDDKGVFLFIGKNGIGKSNFLNAVCWCLYGKQPFKFHDKDKRLLNEEVAKLTPHAPVSVEIEVIMDENIYSFRRSKVEIQDGRFSVMKKVGQDWEEAENPTIIVNNFLPESVMNFFVFDGEAIQNLFKGDYSKNIKDSVWKVSDVEILDDSLEHLKNTNEELRKKLSRDLPKNDLKEEELATMNKYISKTQLEIQEKETLLSKIKDQLDELKKKETHYSKYKDLHLKKEELGNQLSISTNRALEYQKEINNLLINIGSFYYTRHILEDVKNAVSKDIKKGEIPPDIRSKFIIDLIDRGKCICGHDIKKGSVEYVELNNLLNTVSPKEEREILLSDNYFINKILSDLDLLPAQLKGLKEKIARERVEIEKSQRQLKDIKEQLKNAPDKEVGDLEKTIQSVESQIDETTRELGRLSGELRGYVNSATQIQKELSDAVAKKGQNDIISKKYNLIDTSIKKLEFIRERLIRQVRIAVSSRTDQYFKELIWKKEDFEKIEFDDSYEINVYKTGKSNISTLRDLSTGELKVLGFATLKSLAEISGFNVVPVFVDGPLEYLDEEVKSSFLKQLPKFMPDKQVFIFSVDGELILKFGKEKVKENNFYNLVRSKNSFSTEVITYKK